MSEPAALRPHLQREATAEEVLGGEAYERRSLIVTSNRPFQEWGSIF